MVIFWGLYTVGHRDDKIKVVDMPEYWDAIASKKLKSCSTFYQELCLVIGDWLVYRGWSVLRAILVSQNFTTLPDQFHLEESLTWYFRCGFPEMLQTQFEPCVWYKDCLCHQWGPDSRCGSSLWPPCQRLPCQGSLCPTVSLCCCFRLLRTKL